MIAAISATEIGQAIIGLLVIIGYVSTRFKFHETKTKVEQVHVLVNSQMAQALRRIADLEKALGINAGADIPS